MRSPRFSRRSPALLLAVLVGVSSAAACAPARSPVDPNVLDIAEPIADDRAVPAGDPLELDPRGMATIPAGSFTQGTSDPISNPDERPSHVVYLEAFLIDIREVSAGEYRRCVAAGYCSDRAVGEQHFIRESSQAEPSCTYPQEERADHPMNCLSWEQARTYCAWAGKRLPSEAEWEKAARGSSGSAIYPWGDTPPERTGRQVANLADTTLKALFPNVGVFPGYDDGFAETAPVGSFPDGQSAFGVQDMLGNVLEWTADTYDPMRYVKTDAEAAAGTGEATFKVARGGAWDSLPATVRITRRWGLRPRDRARSLGFRCAADPPAAAVR